jgi:tight adherence protein B
MSQGVLLVALGAGIAVAVLVIGLYIWFDRRRIADEQSLNARLGDLASGSLSRTTDATSILRQTEVSKSILDKYLSGKQMLSIVETDTRQAGISWSTGEFAGYTLAGAMLGVVSALFLDPYVSVAIGIIGAIAPFAYVVNRKSARLKKIEEQLPEAVDMLVNSLRAGYSLQAGMRFVGGELPAPVGPEFNRFYDEQRLGMDVRQALQGLTDRLSTLDSRMFVLAILIQRETGGNLAEILGNISTVIRERINFRAQLDVLTAESKLSAIVLTALPVVMYFVIRASNPDYIKPLTETDVGKSMLLYAGVSLLIGYVVLRKMSQIEV